MKMSPLAGSQIPAGCGVSTVLPDLDFETYSEAGYIWDGAAGKWRAPPGATKKGIFAVGAAAYSEHPSTEILCLAYDLKDGLGPRLWIPGTPAPQELFDHIAAGGLLEAWNDSFEWWIWNNVAVKKLGWPPLPFWQLRDAMAKARAHALPGALGKAAEVLGTDAQKQADGKRLIQKFSCPRNPSKTRPEVRVRPEDDPADAANLYAYCVGDIAAEAAVSAQCPDLIDSEREFWLCTKAMNARGVAIDVETVEAGISILDQALAQYNTELAALTGGTVQRASEGAKLIGWLGAQGVHTGSLDTAHRAALLQRVEVTGPPRRALEIVDLVGSAGVKKLYALQRQPLASGRVHDLFIYHGARTGRDTGADVQPQNLVKQGPRVQRCGGHGCGRHYGAHLDACPWCRTPAWASAGAASGWTWEAVEDVAEVVRYRDLATVERIYGDAQLALSGIIRGMFIAGPGCDLIASDYSSIEAVVAAALAGEEWRLEAFWQRQDIYLVSAGRITGRSQEEYAAYLAEHGHKHPDRQKIGKPAELGLGFGGWINGWRVFDDSDLFTDEDVKQNIKAWRTASPAIVEMWGGQVRGKPWRPDRLELYGLEGAAIAAVQNPGQAYAYRSISYQMRGDALYCRLPSGRYLTYHRPRLAPSSRWEGVEGIVELSFEGWNTNPAAGPMGWIRINTFAGRLFENVVQAVARDLMAHAVVNLERARYPLVLRVHDELVAEVPAGWGSIEDFEAIMATLPAWAAGWPIRAAGGWRGQRYRKD